MSTINCRNHQMEYVQFVKGEPFEAVVDEKNPDGTFRMTLVHIFICRRCWRVEGRHYHPLTDHSTIVIREGTEEEEG